MAARKTTNPPTTPPVPTGPIDDGQLKRLITYHRDSLWSHRWQMAPATEQLEKQTVQALEHYRDLLAVIDGNPPEPEPITQEPCLPPRETAPPPGDPH